MTQTPSNELTDYMKRLGEHINLIYSRLDKMEAKINEMSREIASIKESESIEKREFNDFVNKLTEGLKELLPPLPEETGESLEPSPREKTELHFAN